VGTGSLFLGLKQSDTEAACLNRIPWLRMSGTLFPLLLGMDMATFILSYNVTWTCHCAWSCKRPAGSV